MLDSQYLSRRPLAILTCLALSFALVLGFAHYTSRVGGYEERKREERTTVLEIVSAFVSTYAQIRGKSYDSGAPVPATYRAQAFHKFNEGRQNDEAIRVEMVGVPGRSIKTPARDDQVAGVLTRMVGEARPLAWSDFIGPWSQPTFRTIFPVHANQESCVSCHNELQPDGPRWHLGDLMGAYTLDSPAGMFFRRTFIETGLLGLFAFLFVLSAGVVLLRAQHRFTTARALEGLNQDLTRQNRQLEQAQLELAQAHDELEARVQRRTAEVQQKAAELAQALDSERQFSALQRGFVSMVSHEFRTPLAIIDLTAQGLHRRLERLSALDVKERLAKIRDAVTRMTQLIDSTLNSSKLDAGTFDMNPAPVDLLQLVTDISERQRELTPDREIRVTYDDAPKEIIGDAGLISQMLTNLLSNAIKYSDGQSPIELTAKEEKGQAVLSVRDFGVGIPEEEIPNLFQRFYRASTSTGVAGTGLGLHLTQRLAQMHGGGVQVQSVVGEGSTVTLSLPIQPAAADPGALEAGPQWGQSVRTAGMPAG